MNSDTAIPAAPKKSKAARNLENHTDAEDSDSDSDSDVPIGELVAKSRARPGTKSTNTESSTTGKRKTKTTTTPASAPDIDEGGNDEPAPSQHKRNAKSTRPVDPIVVELNSKTVISPPSPPPSPPRPQKRKRGESSKAAEAASQDTVKTDAIKKASNDTTTRPPQAQNTSRSVAKRTPKTVVVESDSSDEDAL